ncbi:hypothetical protein D1B33_15680 [Lysinibacillus yapensis]|uniref:Uncharacterized protein n=1 Tax=Ureibacillus yapensis TaxID=2304605 RepID=A0A396S4L0_9BACL|nr:hypothetical protein [Lysinibacillus yapensis]RHW33482.1 hypothetical protein D1B33_15680 [Lysinibacillus yapensis]
MPSTSVLCIESEASDTDVLRTESEATGTLSALGHPCAAEGPNREAFHVFDRGQIFLRESVATAADRASRGWEACAGHY